HRMISPFVAAAISRARSRVTRRGDGARISPSALAPALTTIFASETFVTPQTFTKPRSMALGTEDAWHQREGLHDGAGIGCRDERFAHQHRVEARLRRSLDVSNLREPGLTDRETLTG